MENSLNRENISLAPELPTVSPVLYDEEEISTIIFKSGDFDVFSADHINADAGNTTPLNDEGFKTVFEPGGVFGVQLLHDFGICT